MASRASRSAVCAVGRGRWGVACADRRARLPLLTPSDVRRLLRDHGLAPRKAAGQNFLVDPNTVRRIVRTAELTPGEVVLEVGPGLGSLTLGLLPVAGHVHAVEVDPALARALPGTVAGRAPNYVDRLTVHAQDALALVGPLTPAPSALVANLPYNVAVPVLLHLLAVLPSLGHGLVMVQQEVAERLAAPPGSRVYGAPSAKLAWYAAVRLAGKVPRAVFWPVPNVEAAGYAVHLLQAGQEMVVVVRIPEEAPRACVNFLGGTPHDLDSHRLFSSGIRSFLAHDADVESGLELVGGIGYIGSTRHPVLPLVGHDALVLANVS
jgi:ribosomal RNA small subunit methyltransferase A